jgi:predicted metal-dependent hydrolase
VNAKNIEINGVGLVLFEHSKRAKRVSISVRPFKGVRVAVPYGLSFKKAEQFARTRAAWIKVNLEKMQRYEIQGHFNYNSSDGIDRVKAKTMLTRRLQQLARNNGFSYNRVFIRNQRTRWGSCSSKNNISLNMKLVILPDDLIDHVILHELVHTRRKDHSRAFWGEMDKLVGDGKKMASKLRKYGLGLL